MIALKTKESQADPLFSVPVTTEKRRSSAWLIDHIKRGIKEFFTETVTITPILAELILNQCNKGNRTVRQTRVDAYATTMREGRWLLTSQGISFSRDGLLNNGQHRLWAIIASGHPVKMIVTFGEDRQAFQVLDELGVRSGADILTVDGFSNTTALAATARLLRNITFNSLRSDLGCENMILREVVANHPDLPGVVSWAHGVACGLKTSQSGICVAAYLITRKYGDDLAKDWFHRVKTGLNITSESDPVYKLRAIFPGLAGKKTIGTYVAAVTVKAFNASRRGRRIKSLAWRGDERFPEVQ